VKRSFEAVNPSAGNRLPLPLGLAMGLTLGALLAHSWLYRFLTDDAFISFRYAVNLSRGAGLVFNPGFGRVEGYTNFLWVLLLAGLHRLGIPPEQGALALSMLSTVALWAVIARFAWRRYSALGSPWIAIVPLALMAVTRSIAMWSSSGLGTRFFELLIIGGALRLIAELESRERGVPMRSLAAWYFAFGLLMRPEGTLYAVSAFAVAAAWRARAGRIAVRALVIDWLPVLAFAVAHTAFRRLYYGEWLPNTYIAKVGGRAWWSSGGPYFLTWVIEYALWLWLPLVIAGVVWNLRRRAALTPVMFLSLMIPQGIFVASFGGDHFEYRPLDLYFPLLFLLLADGLVWLSSLRVHRAALAGTVLLVALGLWELPWQSHVQFSRRYFSGFPGAVLDRTPSARDFMDPARDPIYRLPGLRMLANAYRVRLRRLTASYVLVRQEEHRMFCEATMAEGKRLARVLASGVLPRDVCIAMNSIGAIPYYSNVRTLDRLGLTDAHVAHSLPLAQRLMAHDRFASLDYARDYGVDLWAVDPVYVEVPPTSNPLLLRLHSAMMGPDSAWVAVLPNGEFLLCQLPRGIATARARMPALSFVKLDDPGFVTFFSDRASTAYRENLSRDPSDLESAIRLGLVLMFGGRYPEALAIYQKLVPLIPGDPMVWENQAVCLEQIGDSAGAAASLARGLEAARALNSEADIAWIEEKSRQLSNELPAGSRAKPVTAGSKNAPASNGWLNTNGINP